MEQPIITSYIAATNNQHKLEEIKKALPKSVKILTLQDIGCTEELPETRDTLEGNSLEKASFIFSKYNIPCFADDSGLEVYALQGAPGVSSAMYAGAHRNSEDNIDLLLEKLGHNKNRKARFRTLITLIDKDGTHVFEGTVNGTISYERRGFHGFGYDPVFVPEGYSMTFAEMTLEEKNLISHRSIAVKKLITYLNQSLKFLPKFDGM